MLPVLYIMLFPGELIGESCLSNPITPNVTNAGGNAS